MLFKSKWLRAGLLLSLFQCLWFVPAVAQTGGKETVVSRAIALSSENQIAAVVALLQPYVREHPELPEAWLLLAQHQYWSNDTPGARRTYEAALQVHPDHPDLRLAYARFLVENGDFDRAKILLQPFGNDHAEAEALRGTVAWWTGNTSEAARRFRRALRTNPTQSDAVSGLASIRTGTRPWFRVVGQAGTDNQPLDQYGTSVETGLFITPLQTVRAEVKHTRLTAGGSVHPVTFVTAGYRSFWPFARIESEIAAGVLSRLDKAYWTGHIDAGLRISNGFRAGSRVERKTYLYTVASLSENVMLTAIQANLTIDRAGWSGEIAVRRERFPDANTKDAAHGWLLAPVLRNGILTLQAGYAYSYQNTEEHRFTPTLNSAPLPGHPPLWVGRYVPYYTPMNVQTHSLTGNVTIRLAPSITVATNGSYGFFGSEEAPFIYMAGRTPRTGIYQHNIQPWNIRSSVSAVISPSLMLQMEGSYMETSWYDVFTFNLSLYARY